MLRRARGTLLRLVRRRRAAVAIGVALTLPAAWVEFVANLDSWWLDGLALVAGATGVALVWAGITRLSPDWTEPSAP